MYFLIKFELIILNPLYVWGEIHDMKEVEEISKAIKEYKSEGKSLFTTSSFQSHSLVLLHILTQIDPGIPVFFINTGYHFPETIEFKNNLAKLWNLNLKEIRSETPRFMQRDKDGRLLFTSDPEHCCSLNKTQPTSELLKKYDIWVNGVRKDQSAVRSGFDVEQPTPFKAMRYHPMLKWSSKMIYQYRKEFDLPSHPLDEAGYMSIGCEPCTRKIDPKMLEREARWYGMNKVECGLHVDLVKSEKNK